jgi:hypothetical protein
MLHKLFSVLMIFFGRKPISIFINHIIHHHFAYSFIPQYLITILIFHAAVDNEASN